MQTQTHTSTHTPRPTPQVQNQSPANAIQTIDGMHRGIDAIRERVRKFLFIGTINRDLSRKILDLIDEKGKVPRDVEKIDELGNEIVALKIRLDEQPCITKEDLVNELEELDRRTRHLSEGPLMLNLCLSMVEAEIMLDKWQDRYQQKRTHYKLKVRPQKDLLKNLRNCFL